MKSNYTHLVFLRDRSGSMESLKNDVIGGFNAFIEDQKKEPGQLTVTSVQFDSQDPYEVLNDFSPINEVTLLNVNNYVPRGSTPLNDSLGKLIVETGNKLSLLKEEDRPEKVIAVIITDGEENSSREYTTAKIKEMISHQEEKYSWKFIYIGANQDAFVEGSSMRGMGTSLNYTGDSLGTKAAFRGVSKMSAKMRSQDLNAFSGITSFTDELQKDYEESLKEVTEEEKNETQK